MEQSPTDYPAPTAPHQNRRSARCLCSFESSGTNNVNNGLVPLNLTVLYRVSVNRRRVLDGVQNAVPQNPLRRVPRQLQSVEARVRNWEVRVAAVLPHQSHDFELHVTAILDSHG